MNALLLKYYGMVVPIGKHDEEQDECLNIKRRYGQHSEGGGEFAGSVISKATITLQIFDKGGRSAISRIRRSFLRYWTLSSGGRQPYEITPGNVLLIKGNRTRSMSSQTYADP